MKSFSEATKLFMAICSQVLMEKKKTQIIFWSVLYVKNIMNTVSDGLYGGCFQEHLEPYLQTVKSKKSL